MKRFVAVQGGNYPEALELLREVFEAHYGEPPSLHIGYSEEHWAWIACDEPFTLDEWEGKDD